GILRLRTAGNAYQNDLVAALIAALGLHVAGDQIAVPIVDVAVGNYLVAGVAALLLLLGAPGQILRLDVLRLVAGGAEDLPGHLHIGIIGLGAVDADGDLAVGVGYVD